MRSGVPYPPSRLDERKHAQRRATALLDLERRGEDHSAGRRQQIEVGEALQPVTAGSVHEVVTRIGWLQMVGLTGIGADRLRAEPDDVALFDQKPNRGRVRPGSVL